VSPAWTTSIRVRQAVPLIVDELRSLMKPPAWIDRPAEKSTDSNNARFYSISCYSLERLQTMP
jgi:hypothetical protein